MRVYLDNCCYNRPFDDQNQLRIRIEAEAKLGIQNMILAKKVELGGPTSSTLRMNQIPLSKGK